MKNFLFIFDYDGVIVDSLDSCINTLNTIAGKHGIPGRISREIIGKMPSVMFDKAFETVGVPAEEYPRYHDEFMAGLRESASRTPVFAGITDIFRLIKEKGHYLAVNTGNHRDTVSRRLSLTEAGNISDIITGAETPGSKSEKICAMMKSFSVLPENTFMIGDTMGDITEGKKAGVRTIAVTYGWQTPETLADTEPEFTCRDVQELNNLVSSFIC